MIDDTKKILSMLQKLGTGIEIENKIAADLNRSGTQLKKMDVDLLVVIGSDSVLLQTLQNLGHSSVPILPIASVGQPDFLFDVTASEFDTITEDLVEKKWTVDRRTRLVATIM